MPVALVVLRLRWVDMCEVFSRGLAHVVRTQLMSAPLPRVSSVSQRCLSVAAVCGRHVRACCLSSSGGHPGCGVGSLFHFFKSQDWLMADCGLDASLSDCQRVFSLDRSC